MSYPNEFPSVILGSTAQKRQHLIELFLTLLNIHYSFYQDVQKFEFPENRNLPSLSILSAPILLHKIQKKDEVP